MNLYNKFSEFLKLKYGCKVYKLPVNIPVSCPNRDGNIGRHGCIFCGEEGAGFENLPNSMGVEEQLKTNMEYIRKEYHAALFIAYFQNYSNTYISLELFKEAVNQAIMEKIAAVYISTRPDCITDEQLEFLQDISSKNNIDIVIEIGLQTVNYHTLRLLNRGHTLAEFIDAVQRVKTKGLDVCAHYIVDLPWDDMDDVIEGAKILSVLRVNQVKLHSLYVLKDTVLGEMYEKGKFKPVPLEEYIERIISFLEYLSPEIIVQRLIGRAPEERTLFCNWDMSWWKIRDMIEEKMQGLGSYQGKKFNYLEPKVKQPRRDLS